MTRHDATDMTRLCISRRRARGRVERLIKGRVKSTIDALLEVGSKGSLEVGSKSTIDASLFVLKKMKEF